MFHKIFFIFFVLQNLASNVETIYGGIPVTDFQFPWIVRVIQEYTDSNYKIWTRECGGSIISKNIIITAAHCVFKDHKFETVVKSGNFDLSSNKIKESKVKSILVHPNYDHYYKSNDIALLQLSEALNIDEHTKPIDLPKHYEDIGK